MKNTLKTFPKGWNSNKMREWKDGFEVELRKNKDLLDFDLEAHDVCCVQCIMKGEYMKIKEILGDETK